MSNKITLTEAQVAQVEALAAYLSQEQIADYFGISRKTFFNICKRDDEVLTRYKKGKARAIVSVAQDLVQQARSGDKTAAIFYLKTQAGWRETNNLDVTSDGSIPPLQVTLAPASLDNVED